MLLIIFELMTCIIVIIVIIIVIIVIIIVIIVIIIVIINTQVDMPIFFYIDPDFLSDPNMAGISNIILSYTFFPSQSDQGQKLIQSGPAH